MPSIPLEATVTLTLAYDGDRMFGRLNVLRPDAEPLHIAMTVEDLFNLSLNGMQLVSTIKGWQRL